MSAFTVVFLLFFVSAWAFLPSPWLPILHTLLKRLARYSKLASETYSGEEGATHTSCPCSPGDLKHKVEHLAKRHHQECHPAPLLTELISEDGAGSWPPRTNHDETTWPAAIRPYKEIYTRLCPQLAVKTPSLDLEVNLARIASFRSQFRKLLSQEVDIGQVREILNDAETGRWNLISRETFNAFYCTVATSRHAFRWATIPVVQAAQNEKSVDMPMELDEPWVMLQRHMGLNSQSGNNMSNIVLNFDEAGQHILGVNVGLSDQIILAEDTFSSIFRDCEVLGLPIYQHIILAISAIENRESRQALGHLNAIEQHLGHLLQQFYNKLHDSVIPRSAWLSHVQGFFAWGAGHPVEKRHDRNQSAAETGLEDQEPEWVIYDGLSGNQILLFMVLDAFLGIPTYLTNEVQLRNVPRRQREFTRAIERSSFRRQIGMMGNPEMAEQIENVFGRIVKRLRVFRSAHRSRARSYLMQPAPERLPMTAGKSLLKSDIEQSIEYLDVFMKERLAQTV